MTSSDGNIFPVSGYLAGEFTGHSTASDAELWCFFDLRLNKRLNKQSRGWWFERHRAHYDVAAMAIPLWLFPVLRQNAHFDKDEMHDPELKKMICWAWLTILSTLSSWFEMY